jgi:hypothetical protein
MLSWNNHIDLLMKKLSMVCYIIRNVKTNMSASALPIIYHAFFHSVMSYGIIFWGNLFHSSTIFGMGEGKKKERKKARKKEKRGKRRDRERERVREKSN